MITIRGKKLTYADRKTVREFTNFVLNKFVSGELIGESKIIIKFVAPAALKGQDFIDIKKYRAWMNHTGGKRFCIVINDQTISNRSQVSITRLKVALECVGHELVHVKQYLNGELKDCTNGDAWYKGQRYKNWDSGEGYWFSGFEIEAYGYEQGLYEVFKTKYNS